MKRLLGGTMEGELFLHNFHRRMIGVTGSPSVRLSFLGLDC